MASLHLNEEGGATLSSFVAQSCAPTKSMPTFEIDVNDANLPAYGPGRSLKGVCALTEFVVRTKPLNDPKVKAEPV